MKVSHGGDFKDNEYKVWPSVAGGTLMLWESSGSIHSPWLAESSCIFVMMC